MLILQAKIKYKLNNTKKNITFSIVLDENKLPESITWNQNDDMENSIILKSLFVSGWEESSNSAATLSLWTKDFRKDEMQHFFVQTVLTMASSYSSATGDNDIQSELQIFFKNYVKNK